MSRCGRSRRPFCRGTRATSGRSRPRPSGIIPRSVIISTLLVNVRAAWGGEHGLGGNRRNQARDPSWLWDVLGAAVAAARRPGMPRKRRERRRRKARRLAYGDQHPEHREQVVLSVKVLRDEQPCKRTHLGLRVTPLRPTPRSPRGPPAALSLVRGRHVLRSTAPGVG